MFERKPLRADVGAEILARIVDGRFAAGAHLNEARVCADLGISRTPLREAMLGLQADGVLLSFMGRGFQVPPLDASEIAELGHILSLLEPAALRESDAPAARTVMEMQNLLSRARLAGGGPDALVETLYVLGRTALAGCRNQALRTLVLRQHRLTLRYVHAGLGRGWDPASWIEAWRTAVDAMRQGDLHGAATTLGPARRSMSDQLATRFPAEAEGTGA